MDIPADEAAGGWPFSGKALEVSKGWGAISRIFSGGNGVLYAIDTAGKLRWYRWTGTTFAKGAGTEIGTGWTGMTPTVDLTTCTYR